MNINKILKFINLLLVINFRVLSKNSELEILITTDKRSRKNYRKTIYFEKRKYSKVELINKINEQIDLDSKKVEEDLNKEIEKFKIDLKPIEDKLSKVHDDLWNVGTILNRIKFRLSDENISEDDKKKLEEEKNEVENKEKKLNDEEEEFDKEKSRIDSEIDTLEYIIKWNKDSKFKKIKKFEEIGNQYIFYEIYTIYDDKNIETEDNFEPNIDNGIDFTNVELISFEYTFKNEEPYNFKYYEFDIDENLDYYKNHLTKNNLTLPELHNKLREEVNKLNEFLNKRHVFIEYLDIFDIIKYLKLPNLSQLKDHIGPYESASSKCPEVRFKKIYDFGFCFKDGVKDIEIKVKRGDEEFIIKCPIHYMFRSVNTTLMNGLGDFFNINKDDFELEKPKTEEDKKDPDFEKKAKKRVEERIRKIIGSINGSEYNYDEFSRKMGDKNFLGNGFTLNINNGVKTIAEAAEEAKKERQRLEEQQKNESLKSKESNNCCGSFLKCSNSGNNNKNEKNDNSEQSKKNSCCCF